MKNYLLYILGFSPVLTSLHAQYISEVIEYVPAPSQYMNAPPWGTPSSARSIIGKLDGHVSLGAFGGYIIFKFENPVKNDAGNPFGVDFTIFGNPLPNWSEPGIVSVMKDENNNNLPDDTWYELAGSDYFFSTSASDYSVTYTNPGGDTARDVPWTDSYGNHGLLKANSFYTQSYYPNIDSFPYLNTEAYTLTGSMITSTVDTASRSGIFSSKRGFGYVDNQFRGKAPYTLPDNPYTSQLENSGGDAFDISWAVDKNGKYIDLDEIDFIRVHSASMNGAGWLGQISTEITGAVDVDQNVNSPEYVEMIIIKDLPPVLDTTDFQLEVFVFRNGRYQENEMITWSTNMSGASVDEFNILHVSGSGNLTLTASLMKNPGIFSRASTIVDLTTSLQNHKPLNTVLIWPNPAQDFIQIQGNLEGDVIICNSRGSVVLHKYLYQEEGTIDIRSLKSGIYIVKIMSGTGRLVNKFVKE